MPTRYYRFAFTVLFSLLSTLFGTAQQQGTRYFASGEGYVTYTYQVFNYQCGAGPFQQWLYTNLDYVDPNGGHNTIGGGGAYFVSPGGPNCPANGPQPTNGIKVGSTAQCAIS